MIQYYYIVEEDCMECKKCKISVGDGVLFCPNCGNKLESEIVNFDDNVRTDMTNVDNQQSRSNKKDCSLIDKKKVISLVGIIVFIFIICSFLFGCYSKKNRSEVLMSLNKDNHLKFTLGEQEFYIGEKVSSYKAKDYTYEDEYVIDNYLLESDSLSVHTFYHDNQASFLGALYCPSSENCKYDDTILVKMNFYKDSDVVVDDYIKIGMKYSDITSKYGKETGTFYQDENLLVWTFSDEGKIGEPYYILKFDKGGLFSSEKLVEIRIGVWWYEGEYQHTVKKAKVEGDVK